MHEPNISQSLSATLEIYEQMFGHPPSADAIRDNAIKDLDKKAKKAIRKNQAIDEWKNGRALPHFLEAAPEQIQRYKEMTREEVDQLMGLERERAKYYSGHRFMTRFTLLPREEVPEDTSRSRWGFPPGGCVID